MASQTHRLVRVALICGIVSSLLYVAMNVFIPMRWDGYSSAAQTVSELSAIGAPTRALWVPLGTVYTLLVPVFGWGCHEVGPSEPGLARRWRVTGGVRNHWPRLAANASP